MLFCAIYFFARTTPKKDTNAPVAASKQEAAGAFDFTSYIKQVKSQLPDYQQNYLEKLENSVVRGNVKEQQVKVYHQLADFWKDTLHSLLPNAYYVALASKLENSEKSLTFAGHNFLEGLRQQQDPALKKWMATEAKELFEKALTINPNNDSTKVGLGSCYLFGNISDNPMQGIQMLREVAERDTTNMYAQFMLAMGGMESGQFDKAAERLKKVVRNQPKNVEAILALAESLERSGNKKEAITWYQASKPFFQEKEILQEIDKRIDLLKK